MWVRKFDRITKPCQDWWAYNTASNWPNKRKRLTCTLSIRPISARGDDSWGIWQQGNINQLLNSVLAKYRDLSMARRSINDWSARHRQITIFCSTSSNNWLIFPCCQIPQESSPHAEIGLIDNVQVSRFLLLGQLLAVLYAHQSWQGFVILSNFLTHVLKQFPG